MENNEVLNAVKDLCEFLDFRADAEIVKRKFGLAKAANMRDFFYDVLEDMSETEIAKRLNLKGDF